MEKVKNEIFSKYIIRKTKNQKNNFICFLTKTLEEKGRQVKIEKGAFGSKNIIVGDIESAKVIFSAHYDTCAVLPFPNFITPLNIPFFVLFQFLIFLVFVLVGLALKTVTNYLNFPFALKQFSMVFVMLLLAYLMMAGKANKNNYNDNTSGVLTLISIILSTNKDDKAAFVFFDNEEKGLIGSSSFRKKHKNELTNKLLINFDCVSDGDYFLFGKSKDLKDNSIIEQAYKDEDNKKVIIKDKGFIYPSDQMSFCNSVAVCAMNKKKIIGYYISKIHTKHDTVFQNENIEFLTKASVKLINIL